MLLADIYLFPLINNGVLIYLFPFINKGVSIL